MIGRIIVSVFVLFAVVLAGLFAWQHFLSGEADRYIPGRPSPTSQEPPAPPGQAPIEPEPRARELPPPPQLPPAPPGQAPVQPETRARELPPPPELPTAPLPAPAIPPTQVAEGARRLRLPIPNFDPQNLHDTFEERRGKQAHEALDLAAPRGTAVLAVDDGVIRKLFHSREGGLTIYQFDPTETYAYYYAHLDRYADRLREGQTVKQGEVIGYVGTSGNAGGKAPHLHFAIFRLGPEKQWAKGEPLNPYPLLKDR